MSAIDDGADGAECPTCGKTYASEHGVAVHHSRAHGEPLNQSECEVCGDVFKPKTGGEGADRFCSRDCYAEWQSENLTGEDNPNGKERATLECPVCSAQFDVNPAQAQRRRCCSRDCYAEWQSENHTGMQNPNGVEWVEQSCHWCGESYEVPPSREKRSRFCSRDCLNEWQRNDGPTGADHWNWKGGSRVGEAIRYGVGPWRRAREKALSTAEGCSLCGKKPDSGLHAHHAVPLLAGGVNSSELLIPLCNSCHGTVEGYTWRIPEIESIVPDEEPGTRGGPGANSGAAD